MDYNVVTGYAKDAFRNYKYNDNKYRDSMKKLYSAGKENPSVTDVILDNTITKGVQMAKQAGSEFLNTFPTSHTLAEATAQRAAFESSANLTLAIMSKAIEAMDIPEDKTLNNIPEKQEFDKAYKELYPRTMEKRKNIISAHRLSMDKVTPKAKWEEKVSFAKPISEYRKDYPKSFKARAKLFISGQVINDKVTPRVKGFFNRLSYKLLIKDGFSFAKKIKK